MAKKKENGDIPIDGKKEASSLLASLDPKTRDRILSGIEQADPALATVLRRGMVRFETLINLGSLSLLKVLRPFPNSLIALATRGLEKDLEDALFSKLSERQGRAIKEERDAMGPRKKTDVDAAREKLALHARELHEQGEINLFPNQQG